LIAFCSWSATVFSAVTRVRYAAVTSAVSASSFALTLYRASERLAIASCKRCSREKPSNNGSDKVALIERGDLVKLNGNRALLSRIACA
jgi:hypothetical protein